MSGNESKAVRLVEYLTRIASLRTKIVRNVSEYSQTLWLHEIPQEKGCFTRAWASNEEFDQDLWIEVQTSHEPELPSFPDLCRDWVDWNTIQNTSDLPELLSEITRQFENPECKEGTDQPRFINETVQLLGHPQVKVTWDKYIEEKWLPWSEQHEKWQKVHRIYSALFTIHQEQLRLGEEYELILAIGLLTWQTPSNQSVRRHLVVANAFLEFEARLGKFSVRPNPGGVNLRPELDMIEIEEQPARAEETAKEKLKESSDDPWDKDCIEGVLQVLVNSISPHGEYHDRLESNRPQYIVKPVVEYAPALILRKRSIRGLTEILRRIKKLIEEGKTIPSEFMDIVEMPKSGREVLSESEGDSDLPVDVEIYFPKPSNAEQRRIIEKTRSASGVLVQGPPGTGKSHTIANLICHLLATGQRTLITAKTPRALKVLERLLPEEMRSLCIILLGSGLEDKRSLEASVRAVLQKNEGWNEDHAQREIKKQEDTLHRIRQERAEIEKRLRVIRESETYPQTIANGTYRGTAAQIAQSVVKDEEIYGWFTDEIPLDIECPLSEKEFFGVLDGQRELTDEKKKELDLYWPDSYPSVELFERLIGREREAIERENSTSKNVEQDVLQKLAHLNEEKIRSIKEILTQLRDEIFKLKSQPYGWIMNAVRDISLGRIEIWHELYKGSAKIITKIDKFVQIADKTILDLPDKRNPKIVLVDAEVLKDHLKRGGRLGWGPFRPKIVKSVEYIIKNTSVNNRLCNRLGRVNLLVDVLCVQTELERAWGLWHGKNERVQGPYSLQLQEFKSMTKILHEILLIAKRIKQCKETLTQFDNFNTQTWHEESHLQTVIQTCIHLLARIRKTKAENEIKRVESQIAALTVKANVHPVGKELLEAIRSRNIDMFASCSAKIKKLDKEKQTALWVTKVLGRLREVAPSLADNLDANATDKCWDERIKQMSAIWRWAQARTWLQNYVGKEDAPSLEKRVLQIEDEIGKTIAYIASLRAWSFCFRRMGEDQRRHMEAWQQSMRKLGKGTGKHAPRHRREAQKHLNKCREAVPAWVMPLHMVWDTVDPAPEMFDMIVVDEASQCGLEALPLLYLGKKILIVGDDKQISPEAVGVPRDTVHRLMEEYLYDFQFKGSFDVESSLFDHGKLRHGKHRITLREHFRCMPEIIRFSNNLCYSDTPLIPLRQYGVDRLLPIRHVYLPNGYREGSHNRVINRVEADAISHKIVELCRDEQYANRTIGVVVLQGDAQARLIEDQLLSLLGAEEMEKRRLVCGNAYSFQGDERDIMFLSMVAAPNERIGPLTMSADERRFNVAVSRARDQIWLFHSVTQNDLSTSCLRRSLLKFFEEDQMESIAGINLEELEKSSQQSNRSIVKPPSPFDSWFEVDVALGIARRSYHVIPQFEVAGKYIDLVVEGGQSRLAVECDGDEFHGVEQYESDMERQRMLERCGWVFFRIRASEFYANRDTSLNGLWLMLDERGIKPQRNESPISDEQGLNATQQELGRKISESNSEEGSGEPNKKSLINSDRVEIGDTVVYDIDEGSDQERQVMITRGISNPEWGTINFETPIAQALLGASIGDEVMAKLPMGIERLRIKKIKKGLK